MAHTIATHTAPCGRRVLIQDERDQCMCFTVYMYAAPQERTLGNGRRIDHSLPLRSASALSVEQAHGIAERWVRQAASLYEGGFIPHA